MSVAGFDVGNDTACVAIARKRGIDVLLNKESKRETPTVVNFGEKMRFLGTDGLAKMGLAPQNTVHQLKRLLGKKFSDPSVQADVAKLPFSVSAAPDGSCLVTVMFQNEQVSFSPEQLMAMVLVDLKKISEAETGVPPVDCVLTVPVFYTEAQRHAMINAAQIAGLNCLRLLNENTATALAYGIFKTDLPENDPVHVAFVDIGHSATQVRDAAARWVATATSNAEGAGAGSAGTSLAATLPPLLLTQLPGRPQHQQQHHTAWATAQPFTRRQRQAHGTGRRRGPRRAPLHAMPAHPRSAHSRAHRAPQVSIVSLRKAGLQVRCHAWDANLGGRDLDELLFDHFAKLFKEPPSRVNIPSNKKASFKLRVAVEKVRAKGRASRGALRRSAEGT